jgi:hypothetical protein
MRLLNPIEMRGKAPEQGRIDAEVGSWVEKA